MLYLWRTQDLSGPGCLFAAVTAFGMIIRSGMSAVIPWGGLFFHHEIIRLLKASARHRSFLQYPPSSFRSVSQMFRGSTAPLAVLHTSSDDQIRNDTVGPFYFVTAPSTIACFLRNLNGLEQNRSNSTNISYFFSDFRIIISFFCHFGPFWPKVYCYLPYRETSWRHTFGPQPPSSRMWPHLTKLAGTGAPSSASQPCTPVPKPAITQSTLFRCFWRSRRADGRSSSEPPGPTTPILWSRTGMRPGINRIVL